MGQVYKVSNSMRAKDRDGNPKSWESQYGTFEVWNVYFEGDDTKYQVNKKPGFQGYAKGQEVYGSASKSQYGGQFKQEQAPEGVQLSSGGQAAAQPKPAAAPSANSKSVEEKLDYLISLVENFLNNQQGAKQKSVDTVVEDIDDGPVDLSSIDY